MADNHSQKMTTKKKRKSYIKDGVVLKVSDIEKECDRLRRRPRAALYPLLPITEPMKMKRKSIHPKRGRRRHRKHCRKRLDQVGIQRRRVPIYRAALNSRTRLVTTTTTSGSEVSSLACSRNLNALHNQKSSLSKPHWASAELFVGGDAWLDVPRAPLAAPEHPHHHHYHNKKHKHRICHHDPLLCGHRTSVATSLKDLRRFSHMRHHRRCDLEAGGAGDKDSETSNSRSRKIVSYIIMSVASFILLMCVALVAVTLRLTPAIDELVRKENEEIYRSMAAGASTSSPTTEGAAVVANNSAPPSGNPG